MDKLQRFFLYAKIKKIIKRKMLCQDIQNGVQ